MATNRVAVWVSHRTLATKNRFITPAGPNEVFVQVISTGICGSDAHNWNNPNVSEELILGHDSAGIIVNIGPDLKDRHVGQRVTVEPGYEFCLRGNTNACANLKYCGLYPTDGTLQQYFTCEVHMTVLILEGISLDEAGIIQPLAIAVQLSASKTVAILPLIIAIAKVYGVRKIVGFDIEQCRLDFALSFRVDIGILSPENSENIKPLKFAFELTTSVLKEHDNIDPSPFKLCLKRLLHPRQGESLRHQRPYIHTFALHKLNPS